MKRPKRGPGNLPKRARWLLAPTAVAHLEGLDAGLDDRSEDRFALAGVGKHVWDLVQEAAEGHAGLGSERSAAAPSGTPALLLGDDGPGLLVADQEAVLQRDEHLRRVRHHHHLRLRQGALHVVEVEDLVVGDEAHLDGGSVRAVLPGEAHVRQLWSRRSLQGELCCPARVSG